jgi:hypothetical protein
VGVSPCLNMQHIASGRLAITLDVILLRTSHMTGGGQNRCCGANRLWRKLEDGTNGGWDEWRMGRMADGTNGGWDIWWARHLVWTRST